jgi:uncharacterized protein with HEPN domain
MIKNPEIFLTHILESICHIEKTAAEATASSFNKDRDRQNIIIREYEIIGEAMKNIPSGFKKKYPNVAWERAIGMRNKLIHEYFGVDFGLVWRTTKDDLPRLKFQITAILDAIGKNKLLK